MGLACISASFVTGLSHEVLLLRMCFSPVGSKDSVSKNPEYMSGNCRK